VGSNLISRTRLEGRWPAFGFERSAGGGGSDLFAGVTAEVASEVVFEAMVEDRNRNESISNWEKVFDYEQRRSLKELEELTERSYDSELDDNVCVTAPWWSLLQAIRLRNITNLNFLHFIVTLRFTFRTWQTLSF